MHIQTTFPTVVLALLIIPAYSADPEPPNGWATPIPPGITDGDALNELESATTHHSALTGAKEYFEGEDAVTDREVLQGELTSLKELIESDYPNDFYLSELINSAESKFASIAGNISLGNEDLVIGASCIEAALTLTETPSPDWGRVWQNCNHAIRWFDNVAQYYFDATMAATDVSELLTSGYEWIDTNYGYPGQY